MSYTAAQVAEMIDGLGGDYNDGVDAFVDTAQTGLGASRSEVEMALTDPDSAVRTTFRITIERHTP